MLTAEQTAIVKATVPLLETGGEALTTHFYTTMLRDHAEVRPLFNQAHQAHGTQPRALAHAVLMYARHIDDLGALGDLPARIIQKHVALQILPEHYPIVGTCLLRAIREVLGEEIATDAVIEAWGAAYWQLADILIGAEAGEYDRLAAAPGGWRGARPFRIARKQVESAQITSFTLVPVDGGPVVAYQPGQYLGLRLTVNGQEVRRNYSLSQMADGHTLRISVKREPGGVASGYLHDGLRVDDVVDVFPPAGEFVLRPGTHPLVLISGGVGITPTLAMAQAALGEGARDVIFIHYVRNPDAQAFGQTLADWQRAHPRLSVHVVFEEGAKAGEPAGRPTLDQLRAWVPAGGEAYVLGPKPFMGFVNRALATIGLPAQRCHHEFFGPAEALD
jgi:nitric oxide dioxygenase